MKVSFLIFRVEKELIHILRHSWDSFSKKKKKKSQFTEIIQFEKVHIKSIVSPQLKERF